MVYFESMDVFFLLTEPSVESSQDSVTVPASLLINESINDTHLISAVNEEYDRNVINVSTPRTSSSRSIDGITSGIEASTSDAAAREKDYCNSNICVNTAGEVTADSDGGMRTSNALVAVTVSRTLGTANSDVEMSNNTPVLDGTSRGDEATAFRRETTNNTAVVDGTSRSVATNSASVAISVYRSAEATGSDGEMCNDIPAFDGTLMSLGNTASGVETSNNASVSTNTSRYIGTDTASVAESVSRSVGMAISDEKTSNSASLSTNTSTRVGTFGIDKSASVSAADDGTVSTNVGGEGSRNTEELPDSGIVTLNTGGDGRALPVEEKVRCVRCYKLRPPQRCPVCRRMVDSLPTHIGQHSGKNPHVISSLLGIRTTYDDDSERGGGESVDGGGISTVPEKRKRRCDPQQCTVCGRTYTKLAEHMARMHGTGDPCMCPVCGKFLRNANTLRTHMQSGTCQKSRVCPVCERTCENDAGLKSHMRSHASADGGQTEDAAQDHCCDDCGHAFPSAEALETHRTLHSSGKHHDCCVCGRSFIHARSLRLHIRMHTGETPFECKACGKGFRSRKGLTEHQSVHTMEKRYACMTCGRRFRLYRTYSRHLVIHSGIKRFKCDQCGMRFSFNHLRKRHMRTHSGEKPYSCADCGDRFTQWNGLYQHRQRRCGRQPAISPPNLL